MHPYLVELAAAEHRRDLIRAADRNRLATEARDRRRGTRYRRRRAARGLLGYASFGFFARLGATRGGSPGIFG